MELFSQRKGLKAVKKLIQIDNIDDDLLNGLWNALTIYYWGKTSEYAFSKDLYILFKRLWHSYFKKPIDTLSSNWEISYQEIREYYFNCSWFEVYDFIEFIANNYPNQSTNKIFINFSNNVLERELSAYRFIDGKITQITAKEEIDEIEEALEATKSLKTVFLHLKSALNLFADRKFPDYRNSIKESISALEAICNLIAKDTKATLGQALKEIEKKMTLHPALRKAFDSLYGYTSNAEGIRHALLDEPTLDFEDAKFMLVSCSGFINYLLAKSLKAGIKL
ncbi:MAG: hypothetical protein FJ264_16990 [Planctomycetes bacterium]|nr:hypothetical protein [Planctomycetota bacterium]MBM4064252.1 hypothetical protein [Planctomycetota bacterium]